MRKDELLNAQQARIPFGNQWDVQSYHLRLFLLAFHWAVLDVNCFFDTCLYVSDVF